MFILFKTLNKEFEIKVIKYFIDEKDLDNFPSQSTTLTLIFQV